MEEKNISYILNNISDLIFITDRYGFVRDINNTITNLLGYERNEILKKNIRNFTTEKFHTRLSDNLNEVLRTGEFMFENEFITKGGRIIPFEIKSRLLEYEGKTSLISIGRNILQRKDYEEKLLKTTIEAEDRERKRIAAELHDNLSPLLSTIKLYADLLQKSSCSKDNSVEIIQTINELANLSIATAKEISINITPSILEDFGLADAIKEFCSYVNNTKSINITVNTKKYSSSKSKITESVLYQSVKELINNTIKHSNAKNISLELKNDNEQIILYYKDDGIGFDIEDKLLSGGGLGLKNIVNKVRSIGGTTDFYSSKNQGMVFIIIVKQ